MAPLVNAPCANGVAAEPFNVNAIGAAVVRGESVWTTYVHPASMTISVPASATVYPTESVDGPLFPAAVAVPTSVTAITVD